MSNHEGSGLLQRLRRGWNGLFGEEKELVTRSDEILDRMQVVTEIARTRTETRPCPRVIRRRRIYYHRPTGHMIGDLVGNQDWKRREASHGNSH